MRSFALLALFAIAAGPGCQSSYVNSPRAIAGRAEAVKAFSHPIIADAFRAKPAITFPARLAVMPVGDMAAQQLRKLDAAGKLGVMQALPQVRAFIPLSSLIDAGSSHRSYAPASHVTVRTAAARMHADAVLIYQVDSHVTDGSFFAPLAVASLGMLPTNRIEVIATAMAVLIDTRSGYVYGTLERSVGRTTFATSWSTLARDRVTDRAAYDATTKLLGDFPDFWRGVVQAHR